MGVIFWAQNFLQQYLNRRATGLILNQYFEVHCRD